MSSTRLTCPCGHTWEHPGPPPPDIRAACPVCAQASGTVTLQLKPGTIEPPPPTGDLVPGQVLAGYEILEEISRGGMGAIYKARQQGLNRVVALKVILPDRMGAGGDAVRRFKREAQAAALFSHPNIVTVYATDLDGPVPYLAMEYVNGIDLHRLVRQGGPLAPAEACRFVLQAAEGLQHAFEQGLVHRDIKPANLMVTPSPLAGGTRPGSRPRVKILDMGLARMTGPDVRTSGDLTRAGEFLGTPDFISPEQAEDSRSADTRSDLYSLGGTFYFLLVGAVPFPEKTLIAKLRRMLTQPPPSPAARRTDVPVEVDAVVRRLLAREAEDRYPTPADLIAELEEVLAGLRVAGPASGRVPVGGGGRLLADPGSSLAPALRTGGPTSTSTGAATLSALGAVPAHPGGVKALAVCPSGAAVLTGGADGTLRVWYPGRLTEAYRVAGDVGPVERVAIAPSGAWAASVALRLMPSEIGVQVWDLRTGAETRRHHGPTDNLLCVAIGPDGQRIAAGSADGSVWVWPTDQPDLAAVRFRGHTGPVTAVLVLPGGESLLTGSEDGTIRQWDLRAGAGRGSVAVPVGKVTGVAFSGLADKRMAIAGAGGLAVRHRDGSFTPVGGPGPVRAAAFSPDGQRLASAHPDGVVRVWRAADGTPVGALTGHPVEVTCVGWGVDGAAVFAGGQDGTLRRWPAPV